ncbi:RagB/SusD family nutrient uptake outer membrane protein [Carboxylicivirga taeanensis]|uniref:RagB/SusD family nutrient uptake outer membrane protein n=1 Tax=Carboxylicivirga taeanensis TaxID=1416875 RepID=UPI003F6DF217
MKKIILIVIVFAGIFTACDDYLDVTPPSKITGDIITDDALSAFYTGAYNNLTSYWYSYAYPGYRSFLTLSEAVGQDVIGTQGIYGGVVTQYRYLSVDNFTSGVTRNFWSKFYETIASCNNGLNIISKMEGEKSDKTKVIEAQLRALRAYCYFDIIRMWQRTYETGADLLVCPIYDQPTTVENAKEGVALSTVREVYDFIGVDLATAIALFEEVDYKRPSKEYIDKSVAYAIAARVYLTKGTKKDGSGVKSDMDKASEYAHRAQNGYALMTKDDFLAGFNEEANSEWMLCLTQSADNSGMSYFFNYWDTRSNDTRAYYKNAVPDPYFKKLFDYGNGYDTEDVRFQLFQEPGIEGAQRVKGILAYPKFKFRESEKSGDILYMRVAEMHLIEAEAIARGGQDNGRSAQAIIDELRFARGCSSVVTATVEEIIKERRRELWGEGVTGIFDINRLQITPVRKKVNFDDFDEYEEGADNIHNTYFGHAIFRYADGSELSAESPYHYLQIPEAEVLNNPKVEGQLPRK